LQTQNIICTNSRLLIQAKIHS